MSDNCNNIDCSLHDELESMATRREQVVFQHLVDGKLQKSEGIIKTFSSKNGVEHLISEDDQHIRLDHLLFANQVQISSPFQVNSGRLRAQLRKSGAQSALFTTKASELTQLDLSRSNVELLQVDNYDMQEMQRFIAKQVYEADAVGGIGGYGEVRQWYQRNSEDYGTDEEARTVHLGIDIWLPEATPVFAPIDSKVHSFANNEGEANYGPTIILEHQQEEETFYTLYGHLSSISIENIAIGQGFKAGDQLATLGKPNENGNWPPHLHFQIITDLLGWNGDFPGVCTHYERAFYLDLCPDPTLLIK